MTDNSGTVRLGPLWLAPGISKGNGIALILTGFFVGILAPYVNFVQPYILTEHLDIPKEAQGVASGDLAFWTEVILISLAGFMGAWSDRSGRRIVFTFGLLVVAASYVLYPLASSFNELLGYRFVYAIGMAAVSTMFVAVQAEYPADNSRGKLVGIMGVISILGVMFVVSVLAPLPARFVAGGATAVEAGRYAYWLTAAIALVGAGVIWAGMARIKPAHDEQASVFDRLRSGLFAARDNPRIALAYGAALVGRADLVVVTVFLSLWIIQVGREQGLSTEDALIQAGIMFGVLQIAALLFAPLMGWLTDRISRVAALAMATGLALVGYVWMGLLDMPMGVSAYPAAAMLGIGQVAAILAATALVGQEAGKLMTGSISGAFTLFGAIGILLATKVGGWLFDHWMPGAPFVVIGIVNGLIMLAAIVLLVMQRGRLAGTTET